MRKNKKKAKYAETELSAYNDDEFLKKLRRSVGERRALAVRGYFGKTVYACLAAVVVIGVAAALTLALIPGTDNDPSGGAQVEQGGSDGGTVPPTVEVPAGDGENHFGSDFGSLSGADAVAAINGVAEKVDIIYEDIGAATVSVESGGRIYIVNVRMPPDAAGNLMDTMRITIVPNGTDFLPFTVTEDYVASSLYGMDFRYKLGIDDWSHTDTVNDEFYELYYEKSTAVLQTGAETLYIEFEGLNYDGPESRLISELTGIIALAR